MQSLILVYKSKLIPSSEQTSDRPAATATIQLEPCWVCCVENISEISTLGRLGTLTHSLNYTHCNKYDINIYEGTRRRFLRSHTKSLWMHAKLAAGAMKVHLNFTPMRITNKWVPKVAHLLIGSIGMRWKYVSWIGWE